MVTSISITPKVTILLFWSDAIEFRYNYVPFIHPKLIKLVCLHTLTKATDYDLSQAS